MRIEKHLESLREVIEELIQENPLGKQWAESPDLLLMVPSDQVSNANTAEWVTKLGGKVDDFGKSYDDLIHLSEDLIIK
jgi:hypothetical protein